MSHKTTFVAAVAVALTLAAGSSAFAKGGNKGGAGRPTAHHNNGTGRHEHRGDRFDRRFAYRGWGYGAYGWDYATYPVAVVETPIVEAPVVEAPVYTTCQPVCSSYDSCGYFGGYRHGHREFHDHGRTGGHGQGGHGGHTGHGKK
jgi:hypothetical protein